MTKGKFGNETSAAKQKKKTILQTYLTSLVSLVLCVTMFFGTTAAWFTDTVTTSQNEIVVGTLDVNLKHASFKSGALETYTDVETQNYKVLKSDIKWEPGYTAVEKFKLTENGTLAFGYKLTITLENAGTLSKPMFEALTKAITVWNYTGNNAANYTLPDTFANMVASDWKQVGTLYEVLNNHLTVFSGTMDATKVAAADAEAEHIIALHMDESFDGVVSGTETVQGQILSGITVRLVATQMPSENDAFGNTYDQQVDLQVTQAVETNDAGETTEDITMTVTNNSSSVSSAKVVVPAGAQLEAGTTALTFNISENAAPASGVTVVSGQSVKSYEIKLLGLHAENSALVAAELEIGKNLPHVELYHNGKKMTKTADSAGEYFEYNETTGILTLYVKNFSPFDMVYGAAVVSNADELVSAVAEDGLVILDADINMGSKTLTVAKNVTIDLNGKVLSGTCNGDQAHLIMVNNTATLNIKDGSANQSGKITYAKGTSNTGWTIVLDGKLNLYSGTIALTGDGWNIGYAVDVRPNAWSTNFTEQTEFHMYGGKIVSSDAAIRVASSSSEKYSSIVASFIMDGGEIDAGWDGVFIQQSDALYDTLNVTINAGKITAAKYPVRIYGPVSTSVNSGADKPMTITIEDDCLVLSGNGEGVNWYLENKIAIGGSITKDELAKRATITIK